MKTQTSPTAGAKPAVKDWTQGNIIQNIWLLSWPVMILGVLYAANLVLEMIWVGKLGAASIAGIGVAGLVVLLVVSVKTGLSAGERAMIARLVGRGDLAGANRVAGQAFVVSTFYGVLITLIGIFLVKPIFSLFQLQPEAVAEGTAYLRIVMTGWLTEAFWMTSFSVMQASGDSLSPMKIAILIRILNALLCPFMVLGWWIFPRLGVNGAAITYIVVTGLGMVICLWVLFSGRTRLRLALPDFRPDFSLMWRMLKIGIPGSLAALGKTFADLVLTWILVPFGTAPLAAHNVLSRIESFINTPAMGFGTAAGVLVGQNLGAGRPERAAKSGWAAVGMVSGIIIIVAIALFIWAPDIIRLFNADPDLVATGTLFLRISVVGYLGMNIVMILQNNVSGAGDTLPAMLISLGMLWIVMVPLSLWLSHYTSLGAGGVRWAIVICYLVGTLAYLAYFRSGRWKRKKV